MPCDINIEPVDLGCDGIKQSKPTLQEIRDNACEAIMNSYSISGLKRDYNIHPVMREINKIKANQPL